MFIKSFYGTLISCIIIYGSAQAETTFNQENCQLRTTIDNKANEYQAITGSLEIRFIGDNVVVPVPEIHLDNNSGFSQINLSWPSPDLLRIDGSPIFQKDYHDDLQSFANIKQAYTDKGKGIYQTPSPGLRGLQSFLTLYLSQFAIQLEFINQEGQSVLNMQVPLHGSDLSLRKLVATCFPQKGADFVESVVRKRELPKSWETSYGLLNYREILDSTPAAYQFVPSPGSTFAESYQNTHAVLEALDKRLDHLQTIAELKKEDSYLEWSAEVSWRAAEVFSSESRIEDLTKSDGLFSQWTEEINKKNKELQKLNELIARTQETIRPIERQFNQARDTYAVVENEIRALAEEIELAEKLIEQASKDISYLQDVLSEYQRSEAAAVSLGGEFLAAAAPSSMDEIERMKKEVATIEQKKKELKKLETVLEVIVGEFQAIIDLQTRNLELFKEVSQRKIIMTNLLAERDQAIMVSKKIEEEIGYISFESLEDHLLTDIELGQLFAKDEVKAKLISDIKTLYKRFDEALAKSRKENEEAILPLVLCSTESFKKSYRGQCLPTNQVASESKRLLYFDSLSSESLEELMSQMYGKEDPFLNRSGLSRIAILAQTAGHEWQTPSATALAELWDAVLYARWRYLAFKTLGDQQSYEGKDFFFKILNSQTQEYNRFIDKAGEALDHYTLESVIYNEELAQYESLEAEYFNAFHKSRLKILNAIELDQVDLEGKGLACLVKETHFLNCLSPIESYHQELKIEQAEHTENRRATLASLLQAALLKMEFLQQEKSEAIERKKSSTYLKAIEEVATNAEQLAANLAELKARKQELEKELEGLMKAQRAAENLVDRRQDQMQRASSELERLEMKASVLRQSLETYRPQIQAYCAKEDKEFAAIEQLDEQINQLLKSEIMETYSLLQKSPLCKI